MYFSGPYRGYWEQQGWGRQAMGKLVLNFAAGEITGEGTDMVGPFTFTGTYSDKGEVRLVKQYLRKHRVLYAGVYDGEGTIHGTWEIPNFDKGPFALSPVSPKVHEEAAIDELFDA